MQRQPPFSNPPQTSDAPSTSAAASSRGTSSGTSGSFSDVAASARRDLNEVGEGAKSAAETVKQQASSLASDARSAASDLAADAKATVSGLASDVSGKASELAEGQKDIVAQSLSRVARAVHGMARELEKESPQIASYAHQAADRLDDMSRGMKDKSVGQLLDDITGYARQQPLTVLAGSLLAGVLLSRFLKSSTPRQSHDGDFSRRHDVRGDHDWESGVSSRSSSQRPQHGMSGSAAHLGTGPMSGSGGRPPVGGVK